MSELSSVRTSRLNSARAQLHAGKSQASALTSLSHLSKSSFPSLTRSQASALSSLKSSHASKLSSHLSEVLENLLVIDEYGFTDKLCRTCQSRLSFEEVIALCIPMDADGNPMCKIEEINFDEITLICLNCYADIVSKRSKARAPSAPKIQANAEVTIEEEKKPVSRAHSKPATPKKLESKQNLVDKSMENKIIEAKPNSAAKILEPKPNPLLSKKSGYKKIARNILASSNNDPAKLYDQVKTKNSDKPQHFNRRQTDITKYYNATFSGGVFKNAIPGQSI